MTFLWVHRLFLLLNQVWFWCSLLHFSFYSLYFSAPGFLFGYFFMIFISLLNSLFVQIFFFFLILLNCLSMFSQSSLTFLETTIFIGQITDLHFFGVGYWKIIVFLSWSHVSLVYHIFGRLVLLSLYLEKQSPPLIFTDWLWERNKLLSALSGILGFLRSLLWYSYCFLSVPVKCPFSSLYVFLRSCNARPDANRFHLLCLGWCWITKFVCSLPILHSGAGFMLHAH